MNGVSSIPVPDCLSAFDVTRDSRIFRLRVRRRHKMKATIPTTSSSRAVTAPMIAFVAFRGVGVGVLNCIVCTGILCKEPIRHGKGTRAKRTLEPMEQTLHLVQDYEKPVTLVSSPD